jgi:uncharacterized protein YkwD
MVDKEYFGHQSPTYGSPSSMVSAHGIKYHMVGENLAGAGSVAEAHDGLMGSPGHRSNILNRAYNKIGIGIVNQGKHGLVVTQLFIGE